MLISPEYRKLNAELHQTNEVYGVSGHADRNIIRQIASWGRQRILDYGCGRCTLAQSLGPAYGVTNYDPCIEGHDSKPEPHPVVVCGDVLEHVEPECLDEVLADLRRCTEEIAFVSICLRESSKSLSDGSNAHKIIQPPEWWAEKLEKAGFEIIQGKPPERTVARTWFILKPKELQ